MARQTTQYHVVVNGQHSVRDSKWAAQRDQMHARIIFGRAGQTVETSVDKCPVDCAGRLGAKLVRTYDD